MDVDVIVLTRDGRPIRENVLEAIETQESVRVDIHRVIGQRRPSDTHRWATIARARNVGKTLGFHPWLMFVDDDVLLAPDCVRRLLQELRRRPQLAALAADYLGERRPGRVARHVAMGATLFHRDILAQFEFRWQQDRCECQCMADDLRSQSYEIDYSKTAKAVHLEGQAAGVARTHSSRDGTTKTSPPDKQRDRAEVAMPVGRTLEATQRESEILVAFDRMHLTLFVHRFLRSLRSSGNSNRVHAVVYGLRGNDIRLLQNLPRVTVHAQPYSPYRVCRSRMFGFQSVLAGLCPETPVAYWDAGDVIFQSALVPLWRLVRANPGKLLVVEEPLELEKNTGQVAWIRSIADPSERAKAIAMTAGQPVVNGGFIAGQAGLLLTYFKRAQASMVGRLAGAGGGDQVILNVLRHEDPDGFAVIADTWNYCLVGRSGKDCKIRRGWYVDLVRQRLVSVVHGNAGTLDS